MAHSHTPGPWEATERHDYREVLAPRKNASWYGRSGVWAVAYMDTDLDEAVQDANARLIAAAPDLLEALETAMQWIKAWDVGFLFDEEWAADEAKIRAAIRRARGEQP